MFGREVTQDNLPQEVDRDDLAISFTKGCYLGQEVVTRVSHLGKNKRHLHQVWHPCDVPAVLEAPKGRLIVLNDAQAEALVGQCRRVTQT